MPSTLWRVVVYRWLRARSGIIVRLRHQLFDFCQVPKVTWPVVFHLLLALFFKSEASPATTRARIPRRIEEGSFRVKNER